MTFSFAADFSNYYCTPLDGLLLAPAALGQGYFR